jgi:hypothetical protein
MKRELRSRMLQRNPKTTPTWYTDDKQPTQNQCEQQMRFFVKYREVQDIREGDGSTMTTLYEVCTLRQDEPCLYDQDGNYVTYVSVFSAEGTGAKEAAELCAKMLNETKLAFFSALHKADPKRWREPSWCTKLS